MDSLVMRLLNIVTIVIALSLANGFSIAIADDPEITPIIDYHHRLFINPVAGLNSRIELVSSPNISTARVLLVLDGQLLALPLAKDAFAVSRVEFPTPQDSLVYQFQTTDAAGRVTLSSMFSASAKCSIEALEKVNSTQERGISEAIRLNDEATLLSGTIALIEQLTGGK